MTEAAAAVTVPLLEPSRWTRTTGSTLSTSASGGGGGRWTTVANARARTTRQFADRIDRPTDLMAGERATTDEENTKRILLTVESAVVVAFITAGARDQSRRIDYTPYVILPDANVPNVRTTDR